MPAKTQGEALKTAPENIAIDGGKNKSRLKNTKETLISSEFKSCLKKVAREFSKCQLRNTSNRRQNEVSSQ